MQSSKVQRSQWLHNKRFLLIDWAVGCSAQATTCSEQDNDAIALFRNAIENPKKRDAAQLSRQLKRFAETPTIPVQLKLQLHGNTMNIKPPLRS